MTETPEELIKEDLGEEEEEVVEETPSDGENDIGYPDET